MIKDGAIGTLREIHNWSSRPMWPQYPTIPTDTPPIPKDFDWTLWLGPSLDRPYHPNYTHTNFRGWYEFGGGSIADMGHYSLWPVFVILDLDSPISVESTPSHRLHDQRRGERADQERLFVPGWPARSAADSRPRGDRPALDIFWYDGGMKPPAPEEVMAENKELPEEGMMFVGDKGKIIGGFRGENPRILSADEDARLPGGERASRTRRLFERAAAARAAASRPGSRRFKGGPPTYGNFLLGGPISDMVNLAAISLRLGGKRLLWDAANDENHEPPRGTKVPDPRIPQRAGNSTADCRDEKGPISLVEATPEGFRLHGRFNQPDRSESPSWPPLVIANGVMYVRDQDALLGYQVRAKKVDCRRSCTTVPPPSLTAVLVEYGVIRYGVAVGSGAR